MKKALCILLAVFLIALCCGCSLTITTIEEYQNTIDPNTSSTQNEGSTTGTLPLPEKSETKQPVATIRNKKTLVCYDSLTEKQKQLYKIIEVACRDAISDKIYLDNNAEKNDVYIAFDAVIDDHPEFFWMGDRISCVKNRKEIFFNLNFIVDVSEISAMKTKFNNKIGQIKNSITGTTDYQVALSIHDFLCESVSYIKNKNDNLLIYTAYGALINGEAVCQGYAEAMMYLCNLYGVDCMLVSGKDKNDMPHMWNQVNLSGQWYNIDVTFDDVGAKPFYTYFCVSNTFIKNDHTFFPRLLLSKEEEYAGDYYNFYIAPCNRDDLNYFKKNNRVLSNDIEASHSIIINKAVSDITEGCFLVDFAFLDYVPSTLSSDNLERIYGISDCVNKINQKLKAYGLPEVKLKSYTFVGNSFRLKFEKR